MDRNSLLNALGILLGRVLWYVCDLLLYIQVGWHRRFLPLWLGVDLDSSNHWLVRHLRVEVDEHVEVVLHRAQAHGLQLCHVLNLVCLQSHEFRSWNTSLLLHLLLVLLNREEKRVGKGLVVASFFKTSFKNLTCRLRVIVDKDVGDLAFFKMLTFWQIYRHLAALVWLLGLSKQELLVENGTWSSPKTS